jgi:putative SOS response-associated peptidase YedK
LYGEYPDKQGERRLAFTILTTSPNPQMAQIHDRMPVILPEGAEAIWLDPKATDAETVKPLLQPYDPEGRLLEIAPYTA